MNGKVLAKIISKQIPLSKAMGISVVHCSATKGVKFKLPLAPNKNHKNTAFGGTLVASQAIACWAYIMAILEVNAVTAEVVLQRQTGEFLLPVGRDFIVKTLVIPASSIELFLHALTRKGKARLPVSAQVLVEKKCAATYLGEYVALMKK